MKKNLGFRVWFYFRFGWSQYFAFLIAAINTLVVTYFLAIERYPFLKEIFPTFLQYALILISVGIPLLIVVGYTHWKKTSGERAGVDIVQEIDPYRKRTLANTEILLMLNLKLSQLIIKMSSKKEVTQEELEEVEKLQKEFEDSTKELGFRTEMNKRLMRIDG